jgi:hypothetical protein
MTLFLRAMGGGMVVILKDIISRPFNYVEKMAISKC